MSVVPIVPDRSVVLGVPVVPVVPGVVVVPGRMVVPGVVVMPGCVAVPGVVVMPGCVVVLGGVVVVPGWVVVPVCANARPPAMAKLAAAAMIVLVLIFYTPCVEWIGTFARYFAATRLGQRPCPCSYIIPGDQAPKIRDLLPSHEPLVGVSRPATIIVPTHSAPNKHPPSVALGRDAGAAHATCKHLRPGSSPLKSRPAILASG